jgi:hypothetical protein
LPFRLLLPPLLLPGRGLARLRRFSRLRGFARLYGPSWLRRPARLLRGAFREAEELHALIGELLFYFAHRPHNTFGFFHITPNDQGKVFLRPYRVSHPGAGGA